MRIVCTWPKFDTFQIFLYIKYLLTVRRNCIARSRSEQRGMTAKQSYPSPTYTSTYTAAYRSHAINLGVAALYVKTPFVAFVAPLPHNYLCKGFCVLRIVLRQF